MTATVSRVADIIEPHTLGGLKRRQWAEGTAESLNHAGLLVGGRAWPGTGTVGEQVAANLQCVFDWPTAERIAAELAEAGLLRADEPSTQTTTDPNRRTR